MPGLVGAAAALIIGLPTAGVTLLSLLAGSMGSAQGLAVCVTSGPVAGLSDDQAGNARVVSAVASQRDGTAGAVVAVMTGLAESGLLVLGNPSAPGSSGLPSQGTGHDHDSLGIFQQRAGWGSAAERMDPAASAGLFLQALEKYSGWETRQPWVAAQEVQRSAYDGHPSAANNFSSAVGGNYENWLAEARRIVAVVSADAALSCTSGFGTPAPGPRGAYGLPSGYTVPAGTSATATAVITYAIAQLGKPYVWGADGPDSFDCSGLTMRAWQQGGQQLAHHAATQSHEGTATTQDRLMPGDLVFTAGSDGTLAAPGHVGIFIGDGLLLEAPHSGDVVKVVTYSGFVAHGVAALRHFG
jgi:cell wall-associated NlpC family hydrolase